MDELPKKKFFLDAVHGLQLSYSDFRIAVQNLDHLLKQFARAYNEARNTIAVNDPSFHAFIFGRLCGFDETQLIPWIDLGQAAIPWLEAGFAEVTKDQNIKVAHATYIEKRKKLEAELNALIEKLDA